MDKVVNKIGLILQGGGTRGIFTAGILDAFLDEEISFPVVVGTSAGALNGCNYVAKDRGRSLLVMTKFMHSLRFVSLHNLLFKGSLFDFDYLMGGIEKKLPLNKEELFGNEVDLYVACASLETGEATYFSKHDDEFFKAAAASSSLPFITRKFPLVHGKPYLDGGPVASIPYKKGLELGCDKLVVVFTRPKGYRKGEMSEKKMKKAKKAFKDYPNFIKAFNKWNNEYNNEMDELKKKKKEGRAFLIYPDAPFALKQTETSAKKLQKYYDEAYKKGKSLINGLKDYIS